MIPLAGQRLLQEEAQGKQKWDTFTKTYRDGLWCKQPSQGLIQKQKVHTDCEKGVQSRTLANNIVIQWWPNINTKESLNKLCIKIYFLDLRLFLKSSYEIGSVLLYFHLSVSFLRIGSLIFFLKLSMVLGVHI